MPALIFDYDGLMVDSERVLAECVIDAVSALGGSVTFADMGHLFGTTEADHEWERLLPVWCGRSISLAELEAQLTPVVRPRLEALPLLAGVAELLDAAHRGGWRVGLATGSSLHRVEQRLAGYGVLDRFDAIVTAADVTVGKPAPDIYLEAARRLAVEPSSCVVLEDSRHGCDAALAAGMHVVLCPSAVSAHLDFPAGVRRVTTLTEITLADLESSLGRRTTA